ncbi:MAG TPA: ABC transporter substrate-binding protein [Streptomyces sp.]|nr:ABC transporter substrate-binding protein [Streptomyces sp.]
MSRIRILAAGTALALAAAAAVVVGVPAAGGPEGKRITARFDRAVGVYAGSDLRVLGVKVGTVDAVRPRGEQVEVTLRLDEGVRVPAKAHAAVVTPSIVSDRYIQLAPAYTGGPQIADSSVIPADRTATPMEVDELYESITEVSEALGPDGANSEGALSELLDTGAKNLDGNGEEIGDTIEAFGKAAKTLNGSSDDFFGTVAHLQSFTTMLKKNDRKVRTAQERLAEAAGFLGDDKEELGAALAELGTALGRVKTFIEDNRGGLKKNVDRLAGLTRTLVDRRGSLAEALDTAPLAVGNALNAYDPANRTFDTRADINELSMGGDLTVRRSAAAVGTAGLVPVRPDRQRTLPALPLPPVGTVYGSPDAEKGAEG